MKYLISIMVVMLAGCTSFITAADLADRYHLSATAAERQAPDEPTRAKLRACRKAAKEAADKAKAAQQVLTDSGSRAAAPASRESATAQDAMVKACQAASVKPAPPGTPATRTETHKHTNETTASSPGAGGTR